MEYLNWIQTNLDTVLLLVGLFSVISVVIYWHRDQKNRLDLRDLIMDGPKGLSLGKTGQVIALLVSTWVLIHETRVGRMTEWLFVGYMLAWSGANLAKRYMEMKEPKKGE